MKPSAIFAVVFGAFLLLPSCNEGPQISTPEHIEWSLESMENYVGDIPGDHIPNLKLFMAKASGNAGCNAYNGSFSLQGEKLKFQASEFALTKKMCPPVIMEVEDHYLTLLSEVRRWKINKGAQLLLLNDSGDELMSFQFVRHLESNEQISN